MRDFERIDSDRSPSPIRQPDEALDSSPLQASAFPFDASSDEDESDHTAMDTTTPSGKMKKSMVLSFFTLRRDGRFECSMCHEVSVVKLSSSRVTCHLTMI